LKRQIKAGLSRAVAIVAPALWRMRRASRLLVLMYHRVLPPGHPERATEQAGMFVSPATLAMHLDTLATLGFTFHHLDDWIDAADAGNAPLGLCCSVTFDDGWRDNYDYAFPVLRERLVPATIFLVSDMVGGSYSFWPNRIATLLSNGGAQALDASPAWLRNLVRSSPFTRAAMPVDEAAIDAVIDGCKSHSDAEMLDIVSACERQSGLSAPRARTLMDWQEIGEMRASGLIRFGSHTRRHSRLSKLTTRAALLDELVGSSETIAKHVGERPRVFCYPNGDTTPDAVRLVRENFHAAVTTARGWYRSGQDRHTIPRVGLHEDVSSSPVDLVARLGGL
jgi:peptidoglycan/xylan/chitin deacetylase (PgdA/CDA1 family)